MCIRDRATTFAEQEAAGLGVHVEWDDAGPSAHDEAFESYRHDSADLRAARQATDEEAAGAGVTSFAVLVTVTVLADAELDRAATTVERAARGARFRLSPVRGAQAAAFAGALGIGLSLPDLSVLPQAAREHI